MTQIICFGCSHTYGDGCTDRKKNSWPAQLAAKLNFPVINQGKMGVSSKFIANYILNYTYKPTDIVIILHTYFERTWIMENPQFRIEIDPHEYSTNHMNLHLTDRKARCWQKFLFSEYDCALESVIYQNLAYYHLQQKNIKSAHFLVSQNQYKWITKNINWNIVPYSKIDFNTSLHNFLQTPDGHAEKEGYADFVERIYPEVKKLIT